MSRIGRYEVESEIGRGAMGVVYLARDPRLRRRVAVKTHHVPQGLDARQCSEYRERFLREAHAAAALSHPGIVTVYDADEDAASGRPFIAMEYVAGQSLREALDRHGPLDPRRAVEMAVAVAAALQVAHEQGIVHRDVKPANLLIRDADGAVKVADFGVARVTSSELTQSGTSLGTPAYMSPEQIEGRDLDGRSDLFSLAVILYEALCGARPFDGENVTAVIWSVTRETPLPITKRVAGLPRGLDAFFDKALAKDPARRFADGGEFGAALARAFADASADANERTTRVERAPSSPPVVASAGPVAPERFPSAALRSEPSYPAPAAPWGDEPEAPWWRRPGVIVAAVLCLALLAGWSWLGGGSATLEIEARSSVEKGKLKILVDGDTVYSRRLSARGMPKGLLKKIIDPEPEIFERRIHVAPGRHEVTAEVLPHGADEPFRDSVVLSVEEGQTRRLRLVAGRLLGATVSLKLD